MKSFTESIAEDVALAWLEALGYQVLRGPDIAAAESGAERRDPNCRDLVPERNRAAHQFQKQTQFALGEHG